MIIYSALTITAFVAFLCNYQQKDNFASKQMITRNPKELIETFSAKIFRNI